MERNRRVRLEPKKEAPEYKDESDLLCPSTQRAQEDNIASH
jgi:hypothetical protein